MKFIDSLIRSKVSYGNLIVNDVDDEVRTEKVRKDGKVSRQYYTASLISLDTGEARRVTFFQDHLEDGKKASWGKAFNPQLLKLLMARVQPMPGKIVELRLNEAYEINGNPVDKVKIYVPNEEKEDEVILKFLLDSGLITKDQAQGVTI